MYMLTTLQVNLHAYKFTSNNLPLFLCSAQCPLTSYPAMVLALPTSHCVPSAPAQPRKLPYGLYSSLTVRVRAREVRDERLRVRVEMRARIESQKLENEEGECYLDCTNRPVTMTESSGTTVVSRWRLASVCKKSGLTMTEG